MLRRHHPGFTVQVIWGWCDAVSRGDTGVWDVYMGGSRGWLIANTCRIRSSILVQNYDEDGVAFLRSRGIGDVS